MADVQAVVDFVMRQEDAELSGVITNTPGDFGGRTRYGLTAQWHPQLVEQEFFSCAVPRATGATLTARAEAQIPAVPAARAQVMAEAAYEQQYSGPLFLQQIDNLAIATAMLSFAVVEGNRPAVQMLQAALEKCGFTNVTEEGMLGLQTVDSANSCDATLLLNAWIDQEDGYFQTLVEKNPNQQKFLNGWQNRAAALKQLL